jgi:hypothetical protein
MKLDELMKIDDIKTILCLDPSRQISDYYICDLLSWTLGHIKQVNTAYLTILNSMNVIAVASLLDISCIIFCENVQPTREIIEKAKEVGVSIFISALSTSSLFREIIVYESKL